MHVTRCVCHNVTFAQLWALAQSGPRTLEALSAQTGCCTGCGLCKDYVRLMLLTGTTAFSPIHPVALAALVARPPTKP